MKKKANSVAKKIFFHPYREGSARKYRAENHPMFELVSDENASTDWLYIVLASGRIYHHYVGTMSEDKACLMH